MSIGLDRILNRCEKIGDCLIWTGAFNTDGYPRAFIDGSCNGKLHRYVCSMYYDIEGLVVRHTCDNIKCLNPSHLIPGTVYDNIKDMDSRGRRYKLLTEEIVKLVKYLIEKGYVNKSISEIVGIDHRRVSEIRKGKRDLTGSIVKP